MNKLTMEFQKRFSENLLFERSVLERIDPAVKLHPETYNHPLSSSAACLNVLGSLGNDPVGLIKFLGSFGLEIEEVYEFPSGASFGGRVYCDKGYAIFEWIGPQDSPINEKAGGRGYIRTSVDAFVLGKVDGKTTQILIEWKFTEGVSRDLVLGRFCGGEGIERLRRYSQVLAELRNDGDLPFNFHNEYESSSPKSWLALYDFSPDHLYQLLRLTLLAKKTTRKEQKLGKYVLEDYRIIHLTHSQNTRINVLHPEYLTLSPGIRHLAGKELHEVWKTLLSPGDSERFLYGYWDKAIDTIEDDQLRAYLSERYV